MRCKFATIVVGANFDPSSTSDDVLFPSAYILGCFRTVNIAYRFFETRVDRYSAKMATARDAICRGGKIKRPGGVLLVAYLGYGRPQVLIEL